MIDANDWFERIWEHREEMVYPELFGREPEGIFTIPRSRLEIEQLSDPRWMTCGVFRFSPTKNRDSWLYVSSGLSNEWFENAPDTSSTSGFGCEFVLEAENKEEWPIHRLHQVMCFQIGLCVGRYPGSEPLTVGDRVPLSSPIDWRDSKLSFLLLTTPTRFSPLLAQESGLADFIQVVGISEIERDFAKEQGNKQLIRWLKDNTTFPTTNPARDTMTPRRRA